MKNLRLNYSTMKKYLAIVCTGNKTYHNFSDKDKIALIKSGDLYSKVQQIKLPFNFWHDWVKEQFNFIASRS